jgi:hypothetical protein
VSIRGAGAFPQPAKSRFVLIRWGEGFAHLKTHGRPLQKIADLAVDRQQMIHRLLQFGVSIAGGRDVACPLLGRQSADRVQKQFASFLQICGHRRLR